ncbi:MAG: hypothetical protein ABIH03_09350 [Pseudomonadota bacterium]
MIDFKIDPRSLKLMESALDKATDTMHPTKAINKAGWQICRSAGAAMKVKAATKREVIKNDARTGRGKSARGAKYLIRVRHQGGPDTFLPTNRMTDRRRKIARMNLARSTFLISQGKFGRGSSGSRVRGATKFQRVIKRLSDRQYTASIENRLTYLLTAFPGVVDRAIVKGMTAFIHEFDRDWASAVKEGRF